MTCLVYVEGNDPEIILMFRAEGWNVTSDPWDDIDLLCLEGGADVTPALYGAKNEASDCDPHKDIQSMGLMITALRRNIPVVGICRGSQIVNVMLDGKMIQHVDGHNKYHNIVVRGEQVEVCCGHHQASLPGSSHEGEFIYSDDGVLEIAIWHDMHCMGFQPHPEWAPKGHESRTLFFELLEEIL